MNSISRLGEARTEQEWQNATEFSGYSDFPEFQANLAKYTQNFGMKFRKMSVAFALPPGISGTFGRIESAPDLPQAPQAQNTCCMRQLVYIGETGRNLNTRLTEHKRATRNADADNHIAVHHQLTNDNIDWDSAQCLTYSTNYFQRLTLESWYTNLEQTPLKRCQQLPPPYKRLIHDRNETDKRTSNRW